MLAIIQEYIPKGRRNRPAYPMTPRYITIHDAGNAAETANAKNTSKWVRTNPDPNFLAGWHFTVDDTVIIQQLPLNENGWHASDGASGPGNRQSIAIEICDNRLPNWPENRYQAEEAAAWLVAKLIREVPSLLPFPECMRQHYNWNNRYPCPGILRARSGGWEGFLAQVKECLALPEYGYAATAIAHGEADWYAVDRLVRWKHLGAKTTVLVKGRISYSDDLEKLKRLGTGILYVCGGPEDGVPLGEIPAGEVVFLSGSTYFKTVRNIGVYLGELKGEISYDDA